MSDPKNKKGINNPDTSNIVPPPAGSGIVSPPAGISPQKPGGIPPAAGIGGFVPPPAVGGVVPGVSVPPWVQQQKKVKKVVQEIIEDEGPTFDPTYKGRFKKYVVVAIILSVIMVGVGFYFGYMRQLSAMTSTSINDANKIVKKIGDIKGILEEVSQEINKAYNEGKNQNLYSESLQEFITNKLQQPPITNMDIDLKNYHAFQPETVDNLYLLFGEINKLWNIMENHRNASRIDEDVLKYITKNAGREDLVKYGLFANKNNEGIVGGRILNISAPEQDAEGNLTYLAQEKSGGRSIRLKLYNGGPFVKNSIEWIIPLSDESNRYIKSQDSDEGHWQNYLNRLEDMKNQSEVVLKLHSDVLNELNSVANK